MPKISKITASRLFNLGNYEHVRFEISVDLEEKDSPARLLRELEETLESLNPHNPVSDWELSRAKAKVAEFIERPDPTDADVLSSRYLETVRKHNLFERRRKEAFQRLDALGGTETFTDHKEKWTDDPPY